MWSPMANTTDHLPKSKVTLPSKQIVQKPLTVLGFWSAIALPALYLPLLFTGINSLEGLGLFLGLFGLHVVSLILGQSHRRT